jgi:hypothetical protein
MTSHTAEDFSVVLNDDLPETSEQAIAQYWTRGIQPFRSLLPKINGAMT